MHVRLADASDEELLQAGALDKALRSALGGTNEWVTASKIAACKRPRLIPVRDSAVVGLPGLPNRDYRTDWLVMRQLVRDVTGAHCRIWPRLWLRPDRPAGRPAGSEAARQPAVDATRAARLTQRPG